MASPTTGEIGARSHGWSPELLTLLGAVLAIGVGLAGLPLPSVRPTATDPRR